MPKVKRPQIKRVTSRENVGSPTKAGTALPGEIAPTFSTSTLKKIHDSYQGSDKKNKVSSKKTDALAVVLGWTARRQKDFSAVTAPFRHRQSELRQQGQAQFKEAKDWQPPDPDQKGREALAIVRGHMGEQAIAAEKEELASNQAGKSKSAKKKKSSKSNVPESLHTMAALKNQHAYNGQNVIIDATLDSAFRRSPTVIDAIQGYTKAQRKGREFRQRLFDRVTLKFPFRIFPSVGNVTNKIVRKSNPQFPEVTPEHLSPDMSKHIQDVVQGFQDVGIKLNQRQNIYQATDPLYQAIAKIVRPQDEAVLLEAGVVQKRLHGTLVPSKEAEDPNNPKNALYQRLIIDAFRKKANGEPLSDLETAAYRQTTALHAGRNLSALLKSTWGKPWRAQQQVYKPENRGLYPLRDAITGKPRHVNVNSIASETGPMTYWEITTQRGKPVSDFPNIFMYKGEPTVEEPGSTYHMGKLIAQSKVNDPLTRKNAHIKYRTFDSSGLKDWFQPDLSKKERTELWKKIVTIGPSNSTKKGEENIGSEMYFAQDVKDGQFLFPYDGDLVKKGAYPGWESVNEEYTAKAGDNYLIEGSEGDAGRSNDNFVIGPNGKPVAEKQVSPEFTMLPAIASAKFEDTAEKTGLLGLYANGNHRKGDRARWPYQWEPATIEEMTGS